MADNPQTLSGILNALAQNYRPQIVRTINRRSVLAKLLPIVKGAGKNIAWDVETSGMISESFSDGDDAANFGSDAIQPAVLSWLLNRANFRVTDLAVAAAASTLTPESIVNLYGRNVMNASMALTSTINAAFVAQLVTALQDGNTYAGIDRSSGANALFRANVIDPGVSTAPTLQQIRSDLANTIYTACGEVPDIALCAPAVFLKVASLFNEFRRYNQPVMEVQTARGQVKLDASIGALEFEGCVFVKDKDMTAGEIYYLNSNYVHVEYLEQGPGPMGEPGEVLEADDGFGPVPLGFYFRPLARLGSSFRCSAQSFCNLVVEKPNACGIRKNISTT